jgi:hypothetical protein
MIRWSILLSSLDVVIDHGGPVGEKDRDHCQMSHKHIREGDGVSLPKKRGSPLSCWLRQLRLPMLSRWQSLRIKYL